MVWLCMDVPMYLMFWNRRGAALTVIGSSDSHTACREWAVNHLGQVGTAAKLSFRGGFCGGYVEQVL